jgi:hypothetical protein
MGGATSRRRPTGHGSHGPLGKGRHTPDERSITVEDVCCAGGIIGGRAFQRPLIEVSSDALLQAFGSSFLAPEIIRGWTLTVRGGNRPSYIILL